MLVAFWALVAVATSPVARRRKWRYGVKFNWLLAVLYIHSVLILFSGAANPHHYWARGTRKIRILSWRIRILSFFGGLEDTDSILANIVFDKKYFRIYNFKRDVKKSYG